MTHTYDYGVQNRGMRSEHNDMTSESNVYKQNERWIKHDKT